MKVHLVFGLREREKIILNGRNGGEGKEEMRGRMKDWTPVLTLV